MIKKSVSSQSSEIKAVIYDLDDLMVDSDSLHVEAWEILLKRFNHSFGDLSRVYRSKLLGARVIDICKALIKELRLNISIETFYKARLEIFLKLVREKAKTHARTFIFSGIVKKE